MWLFASWRRRRLLIISEFWINWKHSIISWKFSIRSRSLSTWNEIWCKQSMWFFQTQIIFFACDILTLMSSSIANVVLTLMKLEMPSFLLENWWYILIRKKNMKRIEKSFLVRMLHFISNWWSICKAFTSTIFVSALSNALRIVFYILTLSQHLEMRAIMQCWSVVWDHSSKISKRWWMTSVYY